MNLWDWKAYIYDSSRNLFPFNLILKKEIENLKEIISDIYLNQQKVLDVGTGTGILLRLLPQKSSMFVADGSLKMIKIARQRRRINAAVADSTELPFKSFTFALVSTVGLFEYQTNPLEFLKELHRVMEPNGFVVLTYSQKGLLNYLRNFLGHRVYLKNYENFRLLLSHTGFDIKMIKKSLLQRQVLLYIKNEQNISKS